MVKTGNWGQCNNGGIKQNEVNQYSKGNVHLKTFRGATCKEVFSYVQPTLDRAKSHGIIIHMGTNDASAKTKRPKIFCRI